MFYFHYHSDFSKAFLSAYIFLSAMRIILRNIIVYYDFYQLLRYIVNMIQINVLSPNFSFFHSNYIISLPISFLSHAEIISNHIFIFLLYLLFQESIIKLLLRAWQGQTLIPFCLHVC